MTTLQRNVLCLLWAALSVPVVAADSLDWAAEATTVGELWAGYDPRTEPLDIEITRSWDEQGIHIEQLRFTGETRKGTSVRVFAYRGVPLQPADKVAGVLHIHGGGQTASLEWIRFWGERGYACVSFDFCGKHPHRPAELMTDWGDIDAQMLAPVKPPTNLEPAPRYSAWFHWALVARRALTLLEQHSRVDAKRLGVFGISVGGTLTWLVAGVDERVKAAVPVYGIGQNSYTFPWEQPEELADTQRRRFRDLLECESYAPRIGVPVLWLSSSNDHHGRLDLGMRTLDATKSPILRQAYTPLFMHHVAAGEAKNLPLWMDWHLRSEGEAWPKSPRLRITVNSQEQKVSALVTADRADDVAEVALWWGLNNRWPMSRFYRVQCRRQPLENPSKFLLSVSSPEDVIYGFANVTYRSGIVLSSRLETLAVRDHPVQIDAQRPKLIDAMDTADAWYWVGAPTDPCHLPTLFTPWTGRDGETGFTTPLPVFQFASNLLSDPWRRGRGQQTLQIDVLAKHRPAKFEIEVAERFFQPGGKTYVARPTMDPQESRWTTISIRPEHLRDPQEQRLPNWNEVDYLLLRGERAADGPIVFRNLRWENLEE